MKSLFIMAWAGLKSRKRSSLLLFTSIFLSMLFLTVISVTVLSAAHSAELVRKDAYGEHKITAWNVSDAQYEKLKNTKAFSRIGVITTVGAARANARSPLYIGTADAEAIALGHIRLSEGAMPRTEREIVLEKSANWYLSGKELAVGDPVTLDILSLSGEALQKQFTVSGFIENYTAFWKDHLEFGENPLIPPTFFLSREGADALGLPESRMLLLDSALRTTKALARHLPENISYGLVAGSSMALLNSNYIEAHNYVFAGAGFGGAVLISTSLMLLNGFLMSVDRRRQQLALLRGVGATRRQAYRYVLSEALILAAGGIPAGLLAGTLLSFAAVRFFGSLAGSALTYRFSWWVPLLAAALCLFSTLAAVLIPAVRASRQPPVAAALKQSGRRRKKRGNPYRQGRLGPAGMMWISMKKSKGKALLTILSFSLVIIIFSVMFFFHTEAALYSGYSYRRADVFLFPREHSSVSPPVTRADVRKDIPESIFEDLSGHKDIAFQAATLQPFFSLRIPKEKNDDYTNAAFGLNLQRLGFGSRYSKERDEETEREHKNKAFYELEGSDLFNSIVIHDKVLLNKLRGQVSEGKINIDAIERGEEIILFTPDFAVSIEDKGSDGISYSRPYLSDNPVLTPDMKIFKNTGWKAGDTLNFAWGEKLASGDVKLHEKNVKIGAIVREMMKLSPGSADIFGIVAGINTFTALDLPHAIWWHGIYFKDDADITLAETEIMQHLRQNYPLAEATTQTEMVEYDRRTRNLITSIMAMLMLCILSLGILSLMNTVSNRIYNRSHETGLLRGIGMTKGQILRMFTYEGIIFGFFASLLGVAGSVPLLYRLHEDWMRTATPYYLAATCAACILFSAFAVFLPARKMLRGTPSETVRRNY